jgi:hypothetical protein
VDTSENVSKRVTNRVDYVVSARLTVLTNQPGWGGVSPNLNNTLLALNQNYKLTATAAGGFQFLNWTGNAGPLTNAPTLTFAMQTNLVLTANFADVTKPVCSITNAPAGLTVSNQAFTISGTARDNVAVSNVLYSLNGAPWAPAGTADHWSNWTAAVTLTPGTNTLAACAVDPSGNASVIASNRVMYVVSAQLTVQTSGGGTVSPSYNGALLRVGQTYSMTAKAGPGCVFTNWYLLNLFVSTQTDFNEMGQPVGIVTSTNVSSVLFTNPTISFTMSAPITLYSNSTSTVTEQIAYQAVFLDVTRPVVTIASPTANQQVTSNSFPVRGTASDNVAVGNVLYSLNGAAWTAVVTTNTWTNWTVAVTLNPGTNTIAAYAVDPSGNISLTNTVSFVGVAKTALAVFTNGNGTVTPNDNGALLQIGQNYSLTAKPAAGFAFANWSSLQVVSIPPIIQPMAKPQASSTPVSPIEYPPNYETNLTVLTNQPTLTFAMSSGLMLEASFVDIAPPTVALTAPASKLQVSNALFIVTGTAKDNVAVSNVLYSLNGAEWTAAVTTNQWTNWTAAVTLTPGTNKLAVCAVDTSGNVSAVVSNQVDYVFVLGGRWNVAQWQTPGQITWDATNGLLGGASFGATNGTLTLNPNGTLSGRLGAAFTGSFTVAEAGQLAAEIITPTSTNDYALWVNASQDTMTLADTEDNQQELLIFERAPATSSAASLEGTWNAVRFATPDGMTATNGLVGGDNFAATNGTLTLTGTGTRNGTLDGAFTGSFATGSNGLINVTLVAKGQTNRASWLVNVSQDTLVWVDNTPQDNQQALWLFERAPAAVAATDVVGVWNVVNFTTPAQMTLDADNVLTGGGNFGVTGGTLTLETGGNLTGDVNGAFTGTYAIGANGLITTTIKSNGGTNRQTLYLNAGKTTLMTVDTKLDSADNAQEIRLYQRAPQ